ncbi:MAG TPA: Na+/H+ antiporter [Candidatus Limnocylindria bacterium]|jgi:CPA1 family monovalent cation:H+ antiporter|nr:Na+/H+ antiporter [Candidatus Limnocylindria bacterium]
MRPIELVLLLLAVVTALTVLARRLSVPYPIVMVLGGLALSLVPGVPSFEVPPDLVFLVFLPPLLYAAGYFTSVREFRENLRSIILLAFGLVIFTTVVVALVAHELLPAIGWPGAFALGAIVAPPDAVAATAIFQRVGVPRRVLTILEGESLVNDATALVIYRFAIAAAAIGTFSLGEAGASFVVVLVGGVAVGLVVGAVTKWLLAHIRDTAIAVTITLLAPFAAYLPAEAIGVSGIIATVVAGVIARRTIRLASSDTRVVADAAWQMMIFLLNGLVFILIGLQLPTVVRGLSSDISRVAMFTAAIVIAVVVARIVWVYPGAYVPRLIPAVRRRDPFPPWQTVFVVGWSGLRGVVSLAAALALPTSFPERDLILFVVFAVILVTLVGQGLTLPLVIRALGVAPTSDVSHDETHARALTTEAALARIEELRAQWPGHAELIDQLRDRYTHRARHDEAHHEDGAAAAEQELLEHGEIRREVIDAERRAALSLFERGVINDEILRRLERGLDLEDLRMEA